MRRECVLLYGTALAGLLAGLSPATAQQAPAASPAAKPAKPAASEVVVVTAQRRSEKLADVPASITVLSGRTLAAAGVTTNTDLAKLTPGLTMESYGAFVQPAIRGVTSEGANVGEAPNVATYIDGVYQPQQIATLLELPDIQQIEVLKGPQGALYGQDATGGAILVNSQSPKFIPGGNASLSYGNYNDVNLRGYGTTPLSDTVAVSLAGGYHVHDGYRTDVVDDKRDNGLDSKSIRGKVLYEPMAAVRFTLTAYYTDRYDSSAYAGQAYDNNSIGYGLFPNATRATKPSQSTADPGVFDEIKSTGINLRSEFDVGIGTVTNITAYTRNVANYLADADYSPVQYAQAYTSSEVGRYIQTETDFTSKPIGPVSFIAGVFYLTGSETYDPNGFRLFDPSLPPTPQDVVYNLQEYQNYDKNIVAGYGEVTYRPFDRVFITAGGRYTSEQQRGYDDFGGPVVLSYPGNPVTFNEFTPRVTLRYKLTPDSNFYFSFNKGFKSGGINLTAFSLAPFRPETINAYEGGFKGKILDGLRLNVSAFHYDYTNVQIVQYAPPEYIEQNAAGAQVTGVDFDLSWRVLRTLTLSGGGSYLSAHYASGSSATVFVPIAGGGNNPVQNVSIVGNRLIRAPAFSGNLAANYRIETGQGVFAAYAGFYYNSGYPLEVSNRVHQSSYETVDAELSFAPDRVKNTRFVLWGKNLSNTQYIGSLLQSGFADGISYSDPLTFGGRVEYTF